MADQDDLCQEKQSISSDEEAVQKSNNDNGCPYYFLKPTLLSALSLVGAIHKQYTFKEILSLLKAYIFETKAFDPEDEKFVLCSSDLGKAFGVDRFEYSQVRNLISKNLVCASNVPSSSTSDMEEKVEPISETSSSRYFKIHVPYVPDFQSGPESEYSYQEYDTAVCKDSDCNVDEESEEEEVEYELESEAETDVVKESNSESDVESILFIVGVEDSCNSDEDCFADGSHSSSSSSSSSSDAKDSTDDERDKWPCVNCGIRNKPFMRYCLKCWELRKDWYPDPPKRRRRRKPRPKKGKKRNYLDKRAVQLLDEKATEAEDDTAAEEESGIRLERTSSTASSSSTVTSTSSSALTVVSQDSGFGSQDSTTFKLISLGGKRKNAEPDDAAKKRTKNDDADSVVHNISKRFRKFSDSTEGKRWLKSSDANDLMEKLLLYSSDSETEETIISQENCTLCYARPKNASIIHGRLSHIGFCYPCAKRLYNSKAKCPICRRKIHMITKNSYV